MENDGLVVIIFAFCCVVVSFVKFQGLRRRARKMERMLRTMDTSKILKDLIGKDCRIKIDIIPWSESNRFRCRIMEEDGEWVKLKKGKNGNGKIKIFPIELIESVELID